MSGVRRRDLLARSACLLLGAAADIRSIGAAGAPTPPSPAVLRHPSFLAPEDGEILSRGSGARYDRLSVSYNKRFECVRPETIIYCRSPRAVGKSVRWCRDDGVAFSVRSGGHCYEGTSRNDRVVIDVRGLKAIEFEPQSHVLRVGGGVPLGDAYATVAHAAQAIAAGTCPTVGLAGQALAGGLGFLVRQFGLACDNIVSAEIANAEGDILVADESSNGDLLWALRGAGQASFGIVTRLAFRIHDVPRVTTYDWETTVSLQRSARFLSRWQSWLADAADSVSSSVFLQKEAPDSVLVQLRGTILGNETAIRRQLESTIGEPHDRRQLRFRDRSFAQTIAWFSDGEDGRPVYEKGKSDIVKRLLGEDGFGVMLDALPPGVDAELTALGGAVDRLAPDQTAFPHRAGASLVIQWGISWDRPEQARARLETLDAFYSGIRPLMSASAFLNYADRDIRNRARAYWGSNLERLVAIKQKFDPEDVFRHAMGVPTRLANDDASPPARQLFCREP